MNDRTNKTGISEKKTVSFASFTGVDLHKCTVTLAAVDAKGNVIAKLTTSTKCIDKIQDWLEALPRPTHMAVEAVGFVEWFIDRYCVGFESIQESKNDPRGF